MDNRIDNDDITKLSGVQKKELLGLLLASLLDNLSEVEKKELLQKIVSSSADNLQVIDMVEH